MNKLTQTLATVYAMHIGQTVEFTSGAIVERVRRASFKVTDKHGKVYSSLNKDHAAMIAHKGE